MMLNLNIANYANLTQNLAFWTQSSPLAIFL